MITDFSGIIFDYALAFDKPIIFADTHYDSAPYDAAWFDETLWRFKVLPELGIPLKESDFSHLKTIITDLLSSETYQSGRNRVRDEAWQNRGYATVATVDYMIQKQGALHG